MKKIILTVTGCVFSLLLQAQTVCNPGGNLIIFSNYDGGVLNINVDVNIPDLKIGIVSYEADSVNLSGAFLNNVTGVIWAGYNGTNHHCPFPVITNTSIHGAPTGASSSINILPASPLSNPNGYSLIVCNYSCDNNSSQGGCNTADQVEAYFLQQFPGSVIYSDFTQYGCWSGTRNISSGGNCCATINPLTNTLSSVDVTCAGNCDGNAVITIAGGQSPYSYLWNNGETTSAVNNLCAGNYTVTVTDAGSNTTTGSVTVGSPSSVSFSQTFNGCSGFSIQVGINTYGITGIYIDTLTAVNGCDSTVTTNLNINSPAINTQPIDQIVMTGGNGFFVTASFASATFQWQEDAGSGFIDLSNGIPYSGVTDDTLTIAPVTLSMDSSFYRCIINDAGCSDTTDSVLLTVINSNGVENPEDMRIVIYPNPTDGNLFITGFIPSKIIVINRIGQIVFTDSKKSVVSIQDYTKGIYFIRLFNQQGLPVLTEKIVLQ